MKVKPKFQVKEFVRVADLKRTFSKGETTNWSYKLYKMQEIINDTLSSYHIDKLTERYNEALSKKTELTTEENDSFMKKTYIT